MLLLVGQVAGDQRDREAFQELDYRQVFGPGTLGMAKWVAEVQHADRLPEYVARAFHTAMQGRPGPVVLVLPEDMLTAPTAAAVLPRAAPAQAWPAPGALRDLRALLVAGPSARWPSSAARVGRAESARALQRFAEAWQLPVGCGFRFQDTFDNRHPLYAGDVGIGINPKLAARVRDADLILAIGVRLGEMTTGGYSHLAVPRPAQRLVHLHAGAEELGRVYAADLLLQCSLSMAGQALATLEPPPGALPWQDWAAAAHADYEANQIAPAVAPLDMAAGREVRAAPGAARHGLHQRRGQLQRLAAPLHALRRPAAPWPHPAGADLGRDGLRRAGRRGSVAAVSRAHRGERRRRRRLPDDRPGTRNGAGPRCRHAGAAA